MQVVSFDPDDLVTLKQMAQAYRNSYTNPQSRPGTTGSHIDQQEQQSADVYIALPPSGGIPAMTYGSDDAISGSGSNTYDRPGSADCNIYTIKTDAGGDYLAPCNFQRKVFNFSTNVIQQAYITVHKTKYGHWVPSGVSPSACDLLSQLRGYDADLKQAVVHLPSEEVTPGDPLCEWQTIIQCSTDPVGTGSGSV